MPAPNIILIMADDLGYGDLGSFGSPEIRTPNIDRLGARGVTFTDFHANGPVCTPTRAALLTGRYQQRCGLEGVIYVQGATRATGLDPVNEHCLARSLQAAGYRTALYGKWHLGYHTDFNPLRHGFDHFRGYVSGNVDYHSHVDGSGVADWWDGLAPIQEAGYVTDLVNRHAVRFIEDNHDRPFFLYVAHEAPHFPYQGRRDPADRVPGATAGVDFHAWGSRADRHAAYKEMIEVMDEGVGWIVDTVRTLALDENTLIVFCSDNGAMPAVGSNGGLRGGKGQVYEGGHRVPAIAAWPGTIPPGVRSEETVLSMDLLPTILALTGVCQPPPVPLDGIDVSPALLRQETLPARDTCWRYAGAAAIRRGSWKLVRSDAGLQLFDLAVDLPETADCAGDHPDLVTELAQALASWEADVLAGVEVRTT
jgi:arylsulfatase A